MHNNDGYFGFYAEYYINGEKQPKYDLGTIDSVIVYNNTWFQLPKWQKLNFKICSPVI